MSHKELLARHRKVLPDWVALYYDEPIALDRGEGRHVWDAEGNRYLDFFGGILTTMSGHAVPEVVEAVHAQVDKMLHSSTLYLIEPAIELAERIALWALAAASSAIPGERTNGGGSTVGPRTPAERRAPGSEVG